MLPSWAKQFLPHAISLLAAFVLWLTGHGDIALGWLALYLLLSYAYQRWMLSNLTEWAALPTRRVLRQSPFESSPWTLAFKRLADGIKLQAATSQELTAELEHMHAAVDRMDDSLFLLDRYHHIEWSNLSARSLFGLVNSSGLRRPIHHYIRDPRFSELLDQSLRPGALKARALRIVLPHHAEGVYSLELIRTDEERRVLIVRDVTEQARLDTVRSDFLANVSHELRTPLTVVAGYAETLLDIEMSPAEQRKHLETIARQSQTMKNLVADLLSLSGLEQELDQSIEKDVDVAQMFNDIEAEAKALSAGRHKLSFSVSHPALIHGVADELASALRNLVSNAVRYTPALGTIEVRFDSHPKGACISVKDSGLGIEAQHIPRLTERFYRVDNGRSRDAGGTGLGLAIVKRIANRHDMELEITSSLGSGSQFTLVIPARRISAASAAQQSLPTTGPVAQTESR